MYVKYICTLSDKEKEAIDTFHNFDCSEIDSCSDCPFKTDITSIDTKITGLGTYDKEVESSCIIALIQHLLYKINV